MAGPVSGFTHHALSGYHQVQGHPIQATSQPGAQRVLPPGNGEAIVNGQRVSMTAMNTSGLTSAFPTANSSKMAQRGRMGINPLHAQTILGNKPHLAAQAKRDMDAILESKMNNYPSIKEGIQELSKAHAGRLSPEQHTVVSEAIRDYQGIYGDNFLMNISAMGYESLEHYLQSRDSQYHDDDKVDDFVADFADRYGALNGQDDEQEEIDELRTRLADRLAEPTQLLQEFIHTAPRIPGGPLLKGAVGADNPVTTQLDGNKTLQAILNGEAIHFNGFLSTTSDHDTAMEFVGTDSTSVLGKPEYTIDLTKDSVESEVLRRAALQDLQKGDIDTKGWLFLFKAHNVAGISLNATEEVVSPDFTSHESKEDEILLAPGHYFQPEQVVRNDRGIAVIGNLKYGRD